MRTLILLMGVPGSGKGTQGSYIAKLMQLPHISTGDILRQMAKKDAPDAKVIAKYMREGKLISSDMINKIVNEYLSSDDCIKGCILDGYPRNLEQAKYLINNIEARVITLFFDIDDESAINRISARITCGNCGAVYNKQFNPNNDICEKCNSTDFLLRPDDSKEIVIKRLSEYQQETYPILEFFREKGDFHKIMADRPINEINEEVFNIVKKD